MFCPNCGTKNDDDAVFCANCGTRIVDENPVNQQNMVQSDVVQTQQAYSNVGAQQQNYAMNSNNGMQPNTMNKPASSFKLTKPMIGIIAGAAVVVVALIVVISLGKAASDYTKVAEKYLGAVKSGDWDKAYSLMNLPDSEFLSKDNFKTVFGEERTVDITNVTAEDMTDEYWDDIPSGNKIVKLTYSYAGSSTNSDYIMVDKTGKKTWLFFDEYKVSSDDVVAFDAVFRSPVGMKLYINGVEVSDSYKSDSKSTEKVNYYVIPYMFEGDNKVKVTSDYTEDYEETVYVSGTGDNYTVSTSSLSFKADKVEAVKELAKTDLDKIAAAAVAGKSFKEVGLTCVDKQMSSLENSYTKYPLADCHSSSKDVSSLKLSNVTPSVSSGKVTIDSDDGLPYIKVTLKYSAEGSYTYKSSNTSKDGKSNSASGYITYKYTDGQWKVYKLNVDLYIS